MSTIMMLCVYVQDDEGRDVALKIDRLDSKKCTPDTATKSYIEVRPHPLNMYSNIMLIHVHVHVVHVHACIKPSGAVP